MDVTDGPSDFSREILFRKPTYVVSKQISIKNSVAYLINHEK